ncbi:flippase-like domain-containing protein [Kitasatospora sp. NBC_01287]|uniref:lysylphosphatidylglycerol synthase transmembrane domain-containing protein n=1 Tax=Kitasatospora sp. NBC_01287 TaxID=2903573 RepID=UPI00224E6D02|nr:lysylphosphatidylglycerol synthase transmembrane domain-containing protein [Kitasatospora sp. NBC_01287]MCX4749885.1 flippase-like domain-containing protein [Kitasatospora sp. NBC_01287]
MTTGISQTRRARRPGWVRPRTAIMAAGALVFTLLLYLQGTRVRMVLDADPAWTLLAVLAMAASYPAATMGFLGFVPERIGFARAGLAQLAGAFVKLVAPGGFGGMALNTRLLLRAGIAPGPAASSIGAGSLLGLVLHMTQLAFFLWLTGFQPDRHADGTGELIALVGVGALAVLALALLTVPGPRRQVLAWLRPVTEGSLTRLRDLARHPRHLAVGVLGQLLVSMTLAACLYSCVRATGADPGFAPVAVAFLLGNALGSAVPTPAGVGGVEAATAALLSTTTGLGTTQALAPVVLFRLITLLLPVLPGWAAFGLLQRQKAL